MGTTLQLGINLQVDRVTLCEEQRRGLHQVRSSVQSGFPTGWLERPPARHQLRQARLSLWLADLRNGFVGVAGSGQRKFTAPVLGIMVGTEAFLEDLSLPFCQHIPSESRYRL
ncbi:hypothetical protein JTM36_35105, partial [Pseudomonas aeruginosa]|nr:hypothetical protein [Pseudomonas aeruginosa]